MNQIDEKKTRNKINPFLKAQTQKKTKKTNKS